MMSKNFFSKATQGNAAIEFALILPVLFLLLSGVVNFGLILANKNQLNGVVSAGMLYAFGNSSIPSAVQNAMTASTNLSPLTVSATTFCECMNGSNPGCSNTCPDGSTVGTYVTVTAQSQVTLIALDFILPSPFVTSAQGTIRVK